VCLGLDRIVMAGTVAMWKRSLPLTERGASWSPRRSGRGSISRRGRVSACGRRPAGGWSSSPHPKRASRSRSTDSSSSVGAWSARSRITASSLRSGFASSDGSRGEGCPCGRGVPVTWQQEEPRVNETHRTFSRQHLGELADLTVRIALAIVSMCYVVGFLVVNIHLARYGIVAESLLRVRYIATGALALLLQMFVITTWGASMAVVFGEIARLKAGSGDRPRWASIARIVIVPVFVVGMLVLMIGALSISREGAITQWRQSLTADMRIAIVSFVRLSSCALMTVVLPLKASDWIRGMVSLNRPRNPHGLKTEVLIVDVFVGFLGAILAIIVYTYSVYPVLNPAFGGGAHRRILLLPREAEISSLAVLGLRPGVNGLIGPVSLIEETSDSLILLASETAGERSDVKSIHVPRSSFEGVLSMAWRTQQQSADDVDQGVGSSLGSAPRVTASHRP
jgi:hypothetical protein